jgi:hypothetical protein
MNYPIQKNLSKKQIEAFYHDEFVEDQVRHFISLVSDQTNDSMGRQVTDVGGGCGFFAKRLTYLTGYRVRVIDNDIASIEACQRAGIEAVRDDALNPKITGPQDIVSLNLILHHLVGSSEQATLELQHKALAVWQPHVRAVFVHEYIYESYIGNLSGRLIFQITKNRILSKIGSFFAKFAPSLKANTFGVGVRFRSHAEWREIFLLSGFDIAGTIIGQDEYVSLARRCLLIKNCRRDSFLLKPRQL